MGKILGELLHGEIEKENRPAKSGGFNSSIANQINLA